MEKLVRRLKAFRMLQLVTDFLPMSRHFAKMTETRIILVVFRNLHSFELKIKNLNGERGSLSGLPLIVGKLL